MAFNYARLRATADRLIKRYGATMTMEATTPGVFDRETGVRASTTPTVTVTAVLLEAKTTFLEGALVKRGDMRALVKAGGLSTPPIEGYFLVTNSEGRFYIMEALPLAPNDSTTLLYALTLKRGGEIEGNAVEFGAA